MTIDGISVTVFERADRPCFMFEYRDEVTGRSGHRSSGIRKRAGLGAAIGKIPEFVETLKSERPVDGSDQEQNPSWETFCKRYRNEHLLKRRNSTQTAWQTVENHVNAICKPQFLCDMTYSAVSKFAASLREDLANGSVNSYLKKLRAALYEAGRMFPAYSPPKIVIDPSEARVASLSEVELRTFLAATKKVVGERNAHSWNFGLRLAGWTGLRLNQMCRLSFDADSPVRVEGLDTPDPTLVITKEYSKGKRLHVLKLLPPAIRLLRKIPPDKRRGRVWRPMVTGRGGVRRRERCRTEIGKMVSRIGRASGIDRGERISHTKKGPVVARKYPSIHDLKATFIRRLAELGFSAFEIKEWAQHEDIGTTQHYLKNSTTARSRIDELFAQKRQRKKTLKIRRA